MRYILDVLKVGGAVAVVAVILGIFGGLFQSAQADEPAAGVYGGFGLGSSSDSGSLMADYYPVHGAQWWRKVRVHAQLWTGINDRQSVVTTTSFRGHDDDDYRSTNATSTTTVDTSDPGNLAVGVAWCPAVSELFACVGIAYLANDKTTNIDQHLQSNLALGGEVKGWHVFVQHYSDFFGPGGDENFVMAGKRFAVR